MPQRQHTTKSRKPKKMLRIYQNSKAAIIGGMITTIILIFMGTLYNSVRYYDRVLPGIHMHGINIAGLNRQQVGQIIESNTTEYFASWPITVTYENLEWEVAPTHAQLHINIDESVTKIMDLGRTSSIITNLKARLTWMRQDVDIPLEVYIDPSWAKEFSQQVIDAIAQPVIPPTITIDKSQVGLNIISVAPEQPGREFQQDKFIQELTTSISYLKMPSQTLPVKQVNLNIGQEAIEETRGRAQKLLDQQLTLSHSSETGEEFNWVLTDEDLISFLGFIDSIDQEKITKYLLEAAKDINRPAQDAKFVFNSTTNQVEEFAPALDGIEIDVDSTSTAISGAISNLIANNPQPILKIDTLKTAPEITLEDVNQLGIKELLGRGDSTYYGSIPSRVHNVAVAASRITGTLIKPGEEFSFNASVGDISQATGFKAAYIISNGRTELGDGGGVCQDSTTVFRAALDAGLEITERRGHSYRVGYYEQDTKAGIDATVYSPTTDLKFLNDTPGHLLIQAYADSVNRTLAVEIYGTSDGRISEITNHVVYDITPPLPDQFIDDPSLPTGQVKQIDWKAGGAKAKFDYTVTRNDTIMFEKTFFSTYKPWAAKFLRGTG